MPEFIKTSIVKYLNNDIQRSVLCENCKNNATVKTLKLENIELPNFIHIHIENSNIQLDSLSIFKILLSIPNTFDISEVIDLENQM